MTTTRYRHTATRVLMLLLLIMMAGTQTVWAVETYKAADGVSASVDKTGAEEDATAHVKITYGSGTWANNTNTYGSYTSELHINGGTSGVSFTNGTTAETLSSLPSSGSYVIFEPTIDGTLWLDYKNNNATTNYCWVQVNADGSTKEAFTYIPDAGSDANQTIKFFVTAGKKYYFFANESTIKLYGFSFESGKVWDFTTESTSLTYHDAWTSKYNNYQCKLLDGCYEGLALQQANTWTVTGTGISNNGPGQRGIVAVNLEEGDHIKVEYTLNGNSGFTTYGNRSEEEIGETDEDGHKYRVYRMTANGDFALWIARASSIRKITVIKFKYTESSKEMTKAAYYIPTLFNPRGLTVTSYTSSNTSVASVDGSGQISTIAGGTTTVTATTTEGYKAKIVINVPLDFVWSSTAKVTVSLLDADNNNHVDAYLPTLLNPNGSTVTYTPNDAGSNAAWFASKAWEDPWGLTLYGKPRIIKPGTVTLTAQSSRGDEPETSFKLEITDPELTTGTYQSAYNMYEFNSTGRLDAGTTITNVTGISMQYGVAADPPDLPVVVNSGGMTVIKMIDGNGFSQPNLTNGDATHEYKIPIGGTFYKFNTTNDANGDGKLIITGVFDNPKMYDSDRNEITLSGAGNIRTASLVKNKTYYLYNSGSNQPMLHSYRFVPLASSLTFRNPEPVITVDINEGTYTNTAISTAGLPVTYSKLSGNATVNSETGLVTYTGGNNTSGTVVVQATDGTEVISYILQFAKRTWIFNEKSKWTTTSSELGSNWTFRATTSYGPSDTYSENNAYTYTELIKNGGTVMPETAGLLFNKVANNERLYISPADKSSTYLAMRATDIAIDNVQAGQTVTVNWNGSSSSAVLDITDAAGENVTANRGGTLQLPVTQTGRVTIHAGTATSYINSISISTPQRAIGTLTYAKSVISKVGENPGEQLALSGYSITDESGLTNLKDAYNGLTNFQSSNLSVVTVDSEGKITAVGEGTAFITATATAKNINTHQANVTLVASIEVVNNAETKVRTISISDLLYDTGVSAKNGLNRRIPGFDLTFEGGDGAKVNDPSVLILMVSGTKNGKLTITPRLSGSGSATITKALVTVSSVQNTPEWKVNGGEAVAVSKGGIIYDGLSGSSFSLETTSGDISLTSIKLYYSSTVELDETKVGPVFKFEKAHLMRIPNDGKAFTQVPSRVTTVVPDWFESFKLSSTYASSATNIATINPDGTNGQLLKSGESTITATFPETNYFASSTASYTIDNTLLPDEEYDDIAITASQKIHIEASATNPGTSLTLSGTAQPHGSSSYSLSFGYSRNRQNTYAGATGTLKLTNSTKESITIYSLRVVTSELRAWLYYQGQEDNYFEQVLFTGFESGEVAGFHVVDVGDPDNPIDLTDAYTWGGGSYTFGNTGAFTTYSTSTGAVTPTTSEGSSTLSHSLERKNGMADGYPDGKTAGQEVYATTTIQVLPFTGADPSYTWDFMSVDNGSSVLGRGWTYDDREFQYGYFSEYTPIFNYGDAAIKTDKHGILLKDEFRWYHDRGLRANLSQPKASFKFPVKAGMEIDIFAATSSADISNVISNVTDINGRDTEVLYIEVEGEGNPVHNYFIAKEDGMVEIQATDKVGMYLHSITLTVPKIHFTDDVVTTLQAGDDGAGHIINATTNIEDKSLLNLSYTISTAKNFSGDDVTPSELASIANKGDANAGRVTLTGGDDGYGWFEVTVTNDGATGLEPKTGSYMVYVVDFKFDPETASLNLDNHGGEDYYGGEDVTTAHYPVGKDYVLTPINYSFEIASGNSARAMLKQTTRAVPGQTSYQLTAYSPGEITLRATTGRITAECVLTVGGYSFEKVAPVLSENDITDDSYVFENELPSSFNPYEAGIVVDFVGDFYQTPTITLDVSDSEHKKIKIGNLYGTDDTHRNHGAIRVTSTDNTDATKKIQFVLTLAYPASAGKRWDFYRSTVGLKSQIAHDNKIGDYSNASVADYTITGTNSWTTTTSWSRIYRNAAKEPRWALNRSVHSDNAFIIEETAGLMIETPTNSFYVDNNTDAAYTHIGIHSRSTITIPKLKKGDFIALNLSRVIPNNGAIIEATNVTDLAGKTVNSAFTITRSQTDYLENGVLARDGSGARIIPGYYTFIANKVGAADDEEFDVSFTLADEGYLDVLSIEIYDKTTASANVTNTGNGQDKDNGYYYTMKNVRLDATGYPDAPATLLKEEGQQRVYDLTYCHPLWSTSVGPAEYVVRDQSENLNADFENVGWYSAGGAYYNSGQITVNDGYGRIKLRMENYTADGKYLIGYTPDYSLTVGHPPHQDYPFTWNFENISGGAVKNKGNNAYNSVGTDPYTWMGLGYDSYQLDTRTSGGSLYVPGATLVTEARDLGQKGTIEYLNTNNYGCDEFNGLGFTGKFSFRTALQASEEPATPTMKNSSNGKLLEYTMNISQRSSSKEIVKDKNGNIEYEEDGVTPKTVTVYTWVAADTPTGEGVESVYWTAGDGLIKFGQSGKRVASTVAAKGAAYQLDGGNTKYLLIKPERALKEGDVITLKGYTPNNVDVLRSGFSFYAAQMDNAYDDLLTINWESSDNTQEHTLTHTVGQGDGLAGRDSVYIFRAGKQYSVYLTEISITTTDETPPEILTRALNCNEDVTVTIPDLLVNHYVYIKSSAEPKTVPSNLTKILSTDDGTDGYDVATDVYKYKVIAAGNADVTFANGTEIYRIGVTDIMKPLKRVGTGDAWATESRDHAIDYKQTGQFTVNDITANTVTASNYAIQRVTVKMNPQTDAMPAETGMVLKLPLKGADDSETTANVANFAKAKGGNSVPLFYPPHSTPILSDAVKFGGTQGNLMKENVTEQTFTSETETIDGVDYTPFIFTERYMKWTKIDNNTATTSGEFENATAPVFIRLHVYDDPSSYPDSDPNYTTSNTLGANKAYMLIRSGNVPKALWDTTSVGAKGYIGIAGISDMYELPDYSDGSNGSERSKLQGTYNMQGQKMDENAPLPAGIYIINGRKVAVK